MIQALRRRRCKTLRTLLLLNSVLVSSFIQACAEKNDSAFLHSAIQTIEHSDRSLPVNARVGNGHAVLEVSGTLCGNVLLAFIDMGLNHHTGDAPIPAA